MSRTFMEQAKEMAASAKIMEVLSCLDPEARSRIVFQLVVSTLDENNPRDKKVISSLISQVASMVSEAPAAEKPPGVA